MIDKPLGSDMYRWYTSSYSEGRMNLEEEEDIASVRYNS